MKATGIILLLLVWQTSFSQWTDDFSDGDFIVSPTWIGSTADFLVESNSLRLSAPAVAATSYLSTSSENINDASWQFTVTLDFNPSSSNYAKIYLVSDNSNLTGLLQGYFVKIGNTADEISLYRQDGLNEIEIVDGLDSRVDLSLVNVSVLVTRSTIGEWRLSSKLELESDWFVEGSIIDQTYLSSAYFGVHYTYTSTRSTKFYFDDIIVTGDAFIDTISPLVDSVHALNETEIKILFNEATEPLSTSNVQNYTLNNQIFPLSVVTGDSSAILKFLNNIAVLNQLSIQGVEDLNNNVLRDTTLLVLYVDPMQVSYGDIVINEFMPDPSPREDLPEAEFIELYNPTDRAIDMTGWSFSDKITTALIEDYIFLPDSLLILTSTSNSQLYTDYGNVIGLSNWPSLNNTGDSLTLLNKDGVVIDIIKYEDSWYRDTNKDNGGWSLERINPSHPCSGSLNWQASVDIRGGTPGDPNSVLANVDLEPPVLVSYDIKEDSLHLIFDEPIQSNIGIVSSNPANNILATEVIYNQLYIQFKQPFISGLNNEIIIASVTDCFGNDATSIAINFNPDFGPPKIDTVYTNYPNTVEVIFDEEVQVFTIDDIIIEPLVNIRLVEADKMNPYHFTIHFYDGLKSGDTYLLAISDVHDLFSNVSPYLEYSFVYQPLRYPRFGEVLITEIMADPSPPVNLPEYEYLEITNKTNERLLLKNIWIADEKDEVVVPTGIIDPNERVILTKTTAVENFAQYSKTIGVPNWPTLNNTGDKITLLDTSHNVINHVAYVDYWYDSDEKAAGGWALELIDENNFCQLDRVWSASTSVLGGTPGAINSSIEALPDLHDPHIVEAFAFASDSILIRFDETLIREVPEIGFESIEVYNVIYANYAQDEILLNVEPLQPRIEYELTVGRMIDCAGNINKEEKRVIILPEAAIEGDVLVSEVLFNPIAAGVDFIEIYNNSAKYLSLYQWNISNGVSSTTIDSKDLLFPYSFRVFSLDPVNILEVYPKAVAENIFAQTIPALPNGVGDVAIHNELNYSIDSIHYNEDWHFPYLETLDGVSLSRIDIYGSGTESSNWVSGPSMDNYATPGYSSSQLAESLGNDQISVNPKVIIPNGNGQDDFTTITLSDSKQGSLVTLNIYNLNGQLVKELANNVLVTMKTGYIWDGTDYNGSIVSLGHYIIVSEIITNTGVTEIYREKVVVATGF